MKKPTLVSNRLRRPGESLAGRAYQQIRDEILRGDLAIGDVLSRRKLADRLNMSFLPITEAMQRLEVEGLVESRPRIGTRVRIPTEQDIRNSYVIREALESQAARLCAEHITAAEKKQLLTSARHLDNLHKVSGPEAEDSRFLFSVHTYHMQFHMRIAELAQCPGLTSAIEKAQVLVFNWLYDTAANNNKTPRSFTRIWRTHCVPKIRWWPKCPCERIFATGLTRCLSGWPALNMAITGASRAAETSRW